ncbi:MAG: hypothetical protein J7K21_01280 [Desulfurococcales archaeon]|nr:hypothetical protein [Desulfurococcales archaeon]
MNHSDKVLREIKKAAEDAVFAIKGGPDPRGKRIKRISYVFLSMPDPSSISTMIGISLYVTGSILEKRRKKGIEDLIIDYKASIVEAKKILESIKIIP